MGSQQIQPDTLEERLIYWTIVATWGFWLLGALYVVGPLLGYVLVTIAAGRMLGVLGEGPPQQIHLPFGVILWIAGMLAMLVALVVAHFEYELGMGPTLKSSAGWLKGWALLAVFVLAGATLRIRVAVLYRATGLLALQSLVLAPVFLLAGFVGLPAELYVSPLQIIGGPGPEFFNVSLYAIDDTSSQLRWRFFAPWSTAMAFIAGLWFVFALYERSLHWKAVSIAAAVIVCWMAGSRLSIVAVPLIVVLVLGISNISRPAVLVFMAMAATILVLMSDEIAMAYRDTQDAFNAARAASSRVRATLASIAYHRWLTEAPVFGHGVVERGPHLVQFMPIGSHHTWHGLLFVKGAVGLLGLAVPMAWSIGELALKSQADRVARAGLGVMLAFLLFSFGDNIEITAYLVWPGMLLVGIALRRRFRNPFKARFGIIPA